ncbi:pectinesterase inhibitor 4-like [Nicotiana tabacum]|uniref:21 kDa protein-like n=1 Tax=Nicotiana tabacum TaxID=4097 RepID=A0A1S4CU77_TOBAC|nr:pectinesterase inhibitor 4-like [Nicotiana tomentosiformis]XP_016504787.1 PREDICTED: 21 kDa protein-like [Nicotiana tabacum]
MERCSSNSRKLIKTLFPILVLFTISHTQANSNSNYTNFIESKCTLISTFPPICIKTLVPYASSIQTNTIKLCDTALDIAIDSAKNASDMVSELGKKKGITKYEAAAIKDCITDLKDAVYELKETLGAMNHLNDPDKEFQWDNAKTYASAVISDANSCLDGLSDRKVNPVVKTKISGTISYVTKLASNALAFINHLY